MSSRLNRRAVIRPWTGAFKTKGMSSAYLMKGRNKRSVVLDLKKDEAKEPLRRLVESADVFVHNIRPKAAARLGIATTRLPRLSRTSSMLRQRDTAKTARLSTSRLMTI